MAKKIINGSKSILDTRNNSHNSLNNHKSALKLYNKYFALRKLNKDNIDLGYTTSLNITAEHIAISEILDLINDEKKFNALVTLGTLEDKRKYATALKQFFVACQKNRYKVRISNKHLENINLFINAYAIDLIMGSFEMARDIMQKTNILNRLSNPGIAYTKEFKDLFNILQNPIVNEYLFSPEYIKGSIGKKENFTRIYNDLLFCKEHNALITIKQNMPVSQEFFEELLRDFEKAVASSDNVLESYRALYYYAKNNDLKSDSIIFQKIKKVVELEAEWTDNKMLEGFIKELGAYISLDQMFSRIHESIVYQNDQKFIANHSNEDAMGYNNGKESYINLFYDDEKVLESVISHESLHQLTAKIIQATPEVLAAIKKLIPEFIQDEKITKIKYYGFEIQKHDGDNFLGLCFRGINETTTEYINSRIMGKDYPKGSSGYNDAINCLDLFVKKGIISYEVLKEGYVSNNLKLVINNMKANVPGISDETINKFFSLFDDAIKRDRNLREKAITELNHLYTEMIEMKIQTVKEIVYNYCLNMILSKFTEEEREIVAMAYKDYIMNYYSANVATLCSDINSVKDILISIEEAHFIGKNKQEILEELLEDEYFDKLAYLSTVALKYAKAKMMGEELGDLTEEQVQQYIAQMQEYATKVKSFNNEMANVYLNEGIIDFNYAMGLSNNVSFKVAS